MPDGPGFVAHDTPTVTLRLSAAPVFGSRHPRSRSRGCFVLELLPLVGIALLFWLFIIRPASRRQKELGRMQSSLTVGDEIVLTSGVFATVQGIEDDHVSSRSPRA